MGWARRLVSFSSATVGTFWLMLHCRERAQRALRGLTAQAIWLEWPAWDGSLLSSYTPTPPPTPTPRDPPREGNDVRFSFTSIRSTMPSALGLPLWHSGLQREKGHFVGTRAEKCSLVVCCTEWSLSSCSRPFIIGWMNTAVTNAGAAHLCLVYLYFLQGWQNVAMDRSWQPWLG